MTATSTAVMITTTRIVDATMMNTATITNGYFSDELYWPSGLYLDGKNQQLYVGDTINYRIQKFSLNQTSQLSIKL
ncbi:unnamed protein product [Didymodactylos carnosus]|uniref:Uncharacterized protein n=1 Tax=Didymodactylos carnosus TaxID=1234261 RepID=A0A813XIK4_9BILA|nr:unnamed protein product [Didymodactylos carnosus]CAF0871095.1 unnamed protein product [Didymodactylos carnosus]CAF3579148.1 unnamed protein product [Didymodactylos carnosus]CAF3658359.1 unnamed protein product [Didymodactylos carnosus]